jgi:hypothetical protein
MNDSSPTDRPASRQRVPFDPEFRPAVEEGRLTAQQAAARGRRAEFAERLVARHGLSSEAAYAVADNRLSLRAAMRAREESEARAPQPARSSTGRARSRVRRWRGALIGLIAVFALALFLKARLDARGGSELRVVDGASVVFDKRFQVLQVSAPDPLGVLKAFCETAGGGGQYVALRVVPTPLHDARVGILRSLGEQSQLLAIPIRKEAESANRWVTGDGHEPVIPAPAPAGVEDAIRPRQAT